MNVRENNGSIASQTMATDTVLERLSCLKDQIEAADTAENNPTQQADIVALEASISILSALQDEGISDAEALKDLLFDYKLADKQSKELHRKFEVAARALRRDGAFLCPECSHRVGVNHTHCHWCGKKLGGW